MVESPGGAARDHPLRTFWRVMAKATFRKVLSVNASSARLGDDTRFMTSNCTVTYRSKEQSTCRRGRRSSGEGQAFCTMYGRARDGRQAARGGQEAGDSENIQYERCGTTYSTSSHALDQVDHPASGLAINRSLVCIPRRSERLRGVLDSIYRPAYYRLSATQSPCRLVSGARLPGRQVLT